MTDTAIQLYKKGFPSNAAPMAALSALASAAFTGLIAHTITGQSFRYAAAFAISAYVCSIIESLITPFFYNNADLLIDKNLLQQQGSTPDNLLSDKHKVIVNIMRRAFSLIVSNFALIPIIGMELNVFNHLALFGLQVGVNHFIKNNSVEKIPLTLCVPLHLLAPV